VTEPASAESAGSGLRLRAWTTFAVLSVFLAVVGTLYGIVAGADEPSGVVLLYGASALAAMVAGFVWWSTREAEAQGLAEEHPPDDETATPVYIAAGMALTGLGFIVGPFVMVPGVVVLALAIVLSVRERP
jgi:hypothetical protein